MPTAAKLQLDAGTRKATGKQVDQVRKAGLVPGVIYGHGTDTTPVAIDARQLERIYKEAGTSKLVELKLDGKDTNRRVLFHALQHDPLAGKIRHFDLYEVNMKEEIETEVPIRYIGEAPAVYNQGGVLLKSLDSVEIRALPGDLPEEFEIDLEKLEEINDAVHVKDLDAGSGVTILNDPDDVVTQVIPPKSEEELEAELEEELPEDVEAEVESEHGGEEGEEEAEGEEKAAEEGEEGQPDQDKGEEKEEKSE